MLVALPSRCSISSLVMPTTWVNNHNRSILTPANILGMTLGINVTMGIACIGLILMPPTYIINSMSLMNTRADIIGPLMPALRAR